MTICRICSSVVVGGAIVCDGLCGGSFHPTCVGRRSGSSGGCFTCGECADIRPCHVLRLMRSLVAPLNSSLDIVAEKVNSFSSRLATFQQLSEDVDMFNTKLDNIARAVEVLCTNSTTCLDKSVELNSRLSTLTAFVEELQVAGSDPDSCPSSLGSVSTPIMPAIDDIRRGVRRLRSDLESWSSSVSKDSETISLIASDVKSLVSRGTPVNSFLPVEQTVLPSVSPACPVNPVNSVPHSRPKRNVKRRKGAASGVAVDAIAASVGAEAVSAPADIPNTELLVSALASDASGSPSVTTAAAVDDAATSRGDVVIVAASIGDNVVSAPADLHTAELTDPALTTVALGSSCVAAAPAEALQSPHHLPQDHQASSSAVTIDMSQGVGFTLRLAQLPKSFFISRLDPSTSVDDVIRYVRERSGVDDSTFLRCQHLRSRSSQGLVSSFKLTTSPALFETISSPDFWPRKIIAHEFVPRGRLAGGTRTGTIANAQKN